MEYAKLQTYWYDRGIALDKLGRYEEAIASYDKFLQVFPLDHLGWLSRANALVELGRHEEAITSTAWRK